ncbi:TPA: LexA family transcriptional regulator [Staphylococcus aureus]
MDKEKHLKHLMEMKSGSVKAFSEDIGLAYTTVRSILERGVFNAKVENIIRICKGLNIKPENIMDLNDTIISESITTLIKLTPPRQQNVLNYANSQLDEQNKVTSIDEYKGDKKYEEVDISGVLTAGKGTLNFNKTSPIACTQVLESEVPDRYDLAFQICGDSMEPSFKDGEIAYVLTNTPFVNKRVYAVEINQEAYIKKVYKHEDGFTLVSLNNDKDEDGNLLYPYIEVNKSDDFYIIGRVV